MEAATIPNNDSARILAAAGWPSDPRRLPVLRELLREHLKRIYLYSYEESHNRAAAIDRTRRTLLQVARTVQLVPAGCPLVTWVFLALEGDRIRLEDSPDFWRLLVIAEGDPQAGTASHPTLRPMLSLYRRFLDTPGADEIEPRANWPAAEIDLDCFLCAQFAETGDASCGSAPAWRRWLATRPWRRPHNLVAAAIAVVVVAIALVLVFTLVPTRGRRNPPSGSGQPLTADVAGAHGDTDAIAPGRPGGAVSTTTQGQTPVRSGPGPASPAQTSIGQVASVRPARGLVAPGRAAVRINGARCELATRESLRFAWMPAQGVTEYRLCLITAKRDTLGVVPAISGTRVTVPVSGVPGMVVPGSFIFRVDGLANGRLLAESDPHPFDVP
jgi:hypothetical protein